MKVPFLSLIDAHKEISDEINSGIKNVLNSGRYIGGNQVDSFEENYAKYVDAKYCVGLGNGFDSIQISLRALGVKKGDEVIVPSHTFIATWLAVSNIGAIPVPVEPSEQTFSINPANIKKSITQKTKAIIPVHLYGHPAEIDEINKIAKEHNLFVIEDAAQAHGAIYKNKKIGAHSDVVAWSFYPGKNLGAMGDAGGITTNRKSIADEIRMLGNYGSEKKYIHKTQGLNSRLDPIQASILDIKLKYLDSWNQRRREIADTYLRNISFKTLLSLPSGLSLEDSVWHIFPLRCNSRDKLIHNLSNKGIETLIHYPIPPHKQMAYSELASLDLKIAEKMSEELISLPMGPHLSDEQVSYVVEALSEF